MWPCVLLSVPRLSSLSVKEEKGEGKDEAYHDELGEDVEVYEDVEVCEGV